MIWYPSCSWFNELILIAHNQIFHGFIQVYKVGVFTRHCYTHDFPNMNFHSFMLFWDFSAEHNYDNHVVFSIYFSIVRWLGCVLQFCPFYRLRKNGAHTVQSYWQTIPNFAQSLDQSESRLIANATKLTSAIYFIAFTLIAKPSLLHSSDLCYSITSFMASKVFNVPLSLFSFGFLQRAVARYS